MDADEILNIDYHVKLLVLKALHRYRTWQKASVALGISERTLGRTIKRFGLKREIDGSYYDSRLHISRDNNVAA